MYRIRQPMRAKAMKITERASLVLPCPRRSSRTPANRTTIAPVSREISGYGRNSDNTITTSAS